MITLFHYAHCPFCIRVRLALGYLNISYQTKLLPYEDEKTPVDLCQKKMLPILKVDDKAMNESLDIISHLDKNNALTLEKLNDRDEFEDLLSKLGSNIHSLCMPYWVWTAEFSPESREYFKKKKEAKRGPFSELIKNKKNFLTPLNETLKDLEKDLNPYYKSEHFTILDIMLASHIWGMYIFPEFQFSEKVNNYLQGIKKICSFEYHEDFNF